MVRRCNVQKHLRLRQPAHRKRQRLSHQETTPSSEAVSVTDVTASAYCLCYLLSLRSPSLVRDFRFLWLSLYPHLCSEITDFFDSLYFPHLCSEISDFFGSLYIPISVLRFQISLTLLISLFPVSGCIILPALPDHLRRRTYAEELPFALSHLQNGFASCRPRGLYWKQASRHIRGSLPALLPHHS